MSLHWGLLGGRNPMLSLSAWQEHIEWLHKRRGRKETDRNYEIWDIRYVCVPKITRQFHYLRTNVENVRNN